MGVFEGEVVAREVKYSTSVTREIVANPGHAFEKEENKKQNHTEWKLLFVYASMQSNSETDLADRAHHKRSITRSILLTISYHNNTLFGYL